MCSNACKQAKATGDSLVLPDNTPYIAIASIRLSKAYHKWNWSMAFCVKGVQQATG